MHVHVMHYLLVEILADMFKVHLYWHALAQKLATDVYLVIMSYCTEHIST